MIPGEFKEELNAVKRTVINTFFVCIVLAVVGYFLSGIYSIKSDETGVLLVCGKVADDTVLPGIHYRIPWPVTKIYRVQTTAAKRIQTGFGADKEKIDKLEMEYGPIDRIQYGTLAVPYCITGDKNIVHIKLILEYKIESACDYLFSHYNPEKVLSLLVQDAIIQSAVIDHIDDILTAGKLVLQNRIMGIINSNLESNDIGVKITSVRITNVRPPKSVENSFRDVITAQEERNTYIHDANAYRNRILPEAKAEAAKIISEAKTYSDSKINAAEGEYQRFVALALEYEKEKEITSERLRLECASEVLPKMKKYVLEPSDGNLPRASFFNPGN